MPGKWQERCRKTLETVCQVERFNQTRFSTLTNPVCLSVRLFAFCMSNPSQSKGLFGLNGNQTLANQMVADGSLKVPQLLADFTWLCFSLHEVTGALYALPAVYIWYALNENRKLTFVITAFASATIFAMFIAGGVTFIYFPCSGSLALHFNAGLAQWFYR